VKKIFLFVFAAISISIETNAQVIDGEFNQGEFGFTLGGAHYFGDLNTRSELNRPRPSVGLFFRKNFGNYIALKVAGRFAQVEYADAISRNNNLYHKTRNLSFHSNLFEFSVVGDFNFFKYVPGSEYYGFTPYVTLGVGVFSYDPYTFLFNKTNNTVEKYYLRPLGTEGQAANNTEYGTMAICVPFGVGMKYSINKKVNLNFEISQRFTNTDYLDDVSTSYVKDVATVFPDGPNGPSPAFLLQNRSLVPNDFNTNGRQRGWSKQKDQYVIAEVGVSFNISTYRCPNP
jgi:hypothetical protein